MKQEEIDNVKQMAENLSKSLQSVIGIAHNAIKEVSQENPEQGDELLRDLNDAQNSKDITEIYKIMNKYANYNKQ